MTKTNPVSQLKEQKVSPPADGNDNWVPVGDGSYVRYENSSVFFADKVGNTYAFDFPIDLLSATETFMTKAKQLPSQGFPVSWRNSPLRELRAEMLREEYEEYIDFGESQDDPVEIADGLCDIIVVAWGTMLAYFGPEVSKAIAVEVIRSNLSKVDGSLGDTVFATGGKVMKPQGWTEPDVRGVLRQAGIVVK